MGKDGIGTREDIYEVPQDPSFVWMVVKLLVGLCISRTMTLCLLNIFPWHSKGEDVACAHRAKTKFAETGQLVFAQGGALWFWFQGFAGAPVRLFAGRRASQPAEA